MDILVCETDIGVLDAIKSKKKFVLSNIMGSLNLTCMLMVEKKKNLIEFGQLSYLFCIT